MEFMLSHPFCDEAAEWTGHRAKAGDGFDHLVPADLFAEIAVSLEHEVDELAVVPSTSVPRRSEETFQVERRF